MACGVPTVIFVMGVSGCGKSSVARAVANALGGHKFADGDDFHSAEARAKMAAGVPLSDEDRRPWLRCIARLAAESGDIVIACSALKRSYRTLLAEALPSFAFVCLKVPRDELAQRLQRRADHFMPASLLDSQLRAFEDPTGEPNTIVVDNGAAHQISDVVSSIVAKLGSLH